MNTTLNNSLDPAVDSSTMRRSGVLLWGVLLGVGAAELLTSLVNVQIGMLTHAALLVGLTLRAALGREDIERRLTLGLALAPLIRLLSLSLPLANLPRLAWYPIVAVPLLLATFVTIRQLRMNRFELGLRAGNLPVQLMLIGGGFGLGIAEYLILTPAPLLSSFSWTSLLVAGLILCVSTGFTEELIFRGVLQSLALPALGQWAILYVSLLFAVLHIGYLSIVDVGFVFVVGFAFALIVRWSGSILGVSLAHGLTNITLFLVMPYLASNPSVQAEMILWLLGGSSAIAIVGIYIIMLQSVLKRTRVSAAPGASVGDRLRSLRRDAGITYADLAQRTGLPVRVLAEIEHGMCAPQPEQLQLITAALGVSAA